MKSVMDSSSHVKYYAWPSTVNVANFVTVKLSYEEEEDARSNNFKNWKEQMLCLLESQDVLGFVDGEILPPPENDADRKKQWRRTDKLVKGWILGSIEKEVLDLVREKPTAMDVWIEIDNIFNQEKVEESADFSRYLSLHQAIHRGDWELIKKFFKDITELSTTVITPTSETALHIAVLAGKENNDLVKKMVELTPHEALATKNSDGDTALHIAAVVGNTEAAKALVDKDARLLYSTNDNNRFPVFHAAKNGHRETLEFLISKCELESSPFHGQHGINLLTQTIASGFLDIALALVHKYPSLSVLISEETGGSALLVIAERELLFTKTEYFTWWQNIVYHCIPVHKSKLGVANDVVAGDIENLNYESKAPNNYSTSAQIISRGKLHRVGQKVKSTFWNVMNRLGVCVLVPQVKELKERKTRHEQALQLADYICYKIVSSTQNEATSIFSTSILKAAEHGLSDIVEIILYYYPMVAFNEDDKTKMNIFLTAASFRFENVINLLHNMSDRKKAFFSNRMDYMGNNMMHACGKLAPPNRLNLVSGAALQMQRELHWFKEMENFVNPAHRTWKNKDGHTPQSLFTKEHQQLKADGETWMKDTANACTISAALIATVMFAAAFTVPGGLESTGYPLFSSKSVFLVFAVSDAVSMFTSITSLLMFLSILTSRFAEDDFMYILPKRLTFGLFTLFVSIVFMLVTFSAALYVLLDGHTTWFLALVTVFASLPATSFVMLQFPLLIDVFNSTYGSGIFGKKSSRLPIY